MAFYVHEDGKQFRETSVDPGEGWLEVSEEEHREYEQQAWEQVQARVSADAVARHAAKKAEEEAALLELRAALGVDIDLGVLGKALGLR